MSTRKGKVDKQGDCRNNSTRNKEIYFLMTQQEVRHKLKQMILVRFSTNYMQVM